MLRSQALEIDDLRSQSRTVPKHLFDLPVAITSSARFSDWIELLVRRWLYMHRACVCDVTVVVCMYTVDFSVLPCDFT